MDRNKLTKPYDILLFDADETLLDFTSAAQMALEYTLKQYGFPYSEEIRRHYMTLNQSMWDLYEQGEITKSLLLVRRFELLFDWLGKQADPVAFNEDYLTKLSEGNALLTGAEEICRKLYPHYPMYIVTNGTKKAQANRLATSAIADFFQKVYISEDIGFQKPRREFFDFVLADIGVTDRSRVLLIGDSLTSDIQGGINAEIDTCWFCTDDSVETSMEYTYRISNLSELGALLPL